jgi:hypothetical protein
MSKRKKIYEKGSSIEEVVSLYESLGTVKKVASYFGLSGRTIRNYLKTAGVTPYRGRRKGEKIGPRKHYSALVNWVREHPETDLPRSVPEISKLTGCSPDLVRAYLRRRREKVLDFVEEMPNLAEKSLLLQDEEGRSIPSKAFEWYIRSVDRYGLEIIIRAMLKNGKVHTFRNSLEEWGRILSPRTNQRSPEKNPD